MATSPAAVVRAEGLLAPRPSSTVGGALWRFARKKPLGAADMHCRGLVAKLIRDRQDHHRQRILIVWVDGEDVLADAFRLPALVEQTIALGLGQRGGNGAGG